MDWAEERYVRLYVRDTGDMLAIGWQGRAVFAELMRKVDRAGILDETDPDILAELFRMPLEVCAEGLTRLGTRRVIEVTKEAIVIPNFIEAQEAKQSDKQRQAESRAKRRDRARGRVVTNRDGESQNVTVGHADSDRVTAGHSVLSRTVPSPAVPPSPPSPGGDPSPRSVLEAFAEAYTAGTKRREFENGLDAAAAGDVQYLRDMRDKCGGDVADFAGRIAAKMDGNAAFASGCGIRWWATDAMNSPAETLASSATQPEDPRMQGDAYQEFRG